MRIAIIGRTELLYDTALILAEAGHEIASFVTAKEAPEYKRGVHDFISLANKLHAPIIETPNIEECTDFLKNCKPDIAVSINYPSVIPAKTIEIFPFGILNAHGGDLPRYRGNACQAWAIINGENEIGLCIHKMIGGELDSGDIIAREFYPVNIETKILDVWQWMSERTPILFNRALKRLEQDPGYVLEIQSIAPEDSLRCFPRLPEDGEIDWNKNCLEIIRHINASGAPYSGAFSFFKGKKVIFNDARIINSSAPYLAIPGQVIDSRPEGFVVACGTGQIIVLNATTENPREPLRVKSVRARFTKSNQLA